MNVAVDVLPGLTAGGGKHQQRTLEALANFVGGPITRVSAFAFGTRYACPDALPAGVRYVRSSLPGRIQRGLNAIPGVTAERLFGISAEVVYTTRMWHFQTRGPLVVHIADVSWRHFARQYRTTFSHKQIRAAERAIARAAHITAGSRVTADELIRGGVPANRITVTHLGVDASFAAVGRNESDRVRAAYRLPDQFVLHVGGINERKNIPVLVAALDQFGGRVPMVLAGPPPTESLAAWGLNRPWVRHLGYIPAGDVPGLYAAATVKVFPSKLEGFGLPLVEAMAAGTPVLAADIPVFREVGEDAACFFGPDDIGELARLVGIAFASPDFRAEYRSRGRELAARWTWAAFGQSLLAALQTAAQKSQPR